MIISINYSDKSFRRKQKINSKTAHIFGKVDKVIEYSDEDIDAEFKKKNHKILSIRRGAGLWLWKPYIINKTLYEMGYNDYLVYADSGSVYLNRISQLINKLEETKQDIMLFSTPLLEIQWTKNEVLLDLDAHTDEIRLTPQIMGTFLIIKKTEFSCKFINDWLTLCENEILILPRSRDNNEDELFIEHREDQSLLSVLAKKREIKPFSDPSDYGKFPVQYLFENVLFIYKNHEPSYKLKHTFFLLTRKRNTFNYLILYNIKLMLSLVGLQKIRF